MVATSNQSVPVAWPLIFFQSSDGQIISLFLDLSSDPATKVSTPVVSWMEVADRSNPHRKMQKSEIKHDSNMINHYLLWDLSYCSTFLGGTATYYICLIT